MDETYFESNYKRIQINLAHNAVYSSAHRQPFIQNIFKID